MTTCSLCQAQVDDKRLLAHWRDECPKAAHRFAFRAAVETSLLELMWWQIDRILLDQGFAGSRRG